MFFNGFSCLILPSASMVKYIMDSNRFLFWFGEKMVLWVWLRLVHCEGLWASWKEDTIELKEIISLVCDFWGWFSLSVYLQVLLFHLGVFNPHRDPRVLFFILYLFGWELRSDHCFFFFFFVYSIVLHSCPRVYSGHQWRRGSISGLHQGVKSQNLCK